MTEAHGSAGRRPDDGELACPGAGTREMPVVRPSGPDDLDAGEDEEEGPAG